jgi:dihydrofolate synthase / folylpolyglutamate synthase
VAEPTRPTEGPDEAAYRSAVAWLIAKRRDGRPRDPRVATELLARWGRPTPPAVIHVVGTNGKGTVAHALAAMATAQGLRTGRFTSPHVEDLRERVAVDGRPPSRADVVRFVERARTFTAPGVGFFEWTLVWAIDTFADAAVDLAIVEAGVGARFDATSALPNVIGTVVTNVDLDHLETLGPTLADVARDKAAAARPSVPLVTAARGEALAIVRAAALEVGAPLTTLADRPELGAWPVGSPVGVSAWPATRRENIRLALTLGRRLGWSESALARGLAAAPPPARFERFVVDGPTRPVVVVLDGAHDPAAAARLASDVSPGYVLVFGALGRKQGAATWTPLHAAAGAAILTRPDPVEPSLSWSDLPPTSRRDVEQHEDVGDALHAAVARADARATFVLVAGSLYLAGRARPWLRAHATTTATTSDAEHDTVASKAGAMLGGRWEALDSSA